METTQRNQLLALAYLWMGHFAVDFMLGVWAVYKTLAELDLAICGFIIAVCAFTGEGLQAYFGALSDRGYRFHLIITGIILTSFSAFLSYSDNYIVLFFLLLFTLIGSGAFHPCAASMVNSLSSKNQSLLMSVFQSGGGTGLAVSQLVFYYAFFALEGHTAFLALPALLLCLLILFHQKIFSAFEAPPSAHKARLKDFAQFFRHRELRLLYIAQICNQALVWGMLFLLPDVLLSRGYDSWVSFGGGHFAFVCGMTLFLAPIGIMADRFSLKKVIFCAMASGVVGFYAFLLIPGLSTPLLLLLLLSIGACFGSISPLNVVFGNRLMPNRSGMISAFLMGLVWCISEGVGQLGGGLLSKLFTDDAPARALGCLGILFFAGLYAFSKLPETAKVEEPVMPI